MLTYSPSDVSINVALVHTVTGYPYDNTFIRITQPEPSFSYKRSMDGDIARLARNTDFFFVEITLAQTSTSNDFFQAMFNLDRATLRGKFPVYIKDHKGNSTFFAASCWITQTPDVEYSGGMGTRTWTIHCAQGQNYVGGNDALDLAYAALGAGTGVAAALKDYGLF